MTEGMEMRGRRRVEKGEGGKRERWDVLNFDWGGRSEVRSNWESQLHGRCPQTQKAKAVSVGLSHVCFWVCGWRMDKHHLLTAWFGTSVITNSYRGQHKLKGKAVWNNYRIPSIRMAMYWLEPLLQGHIGPFHHVLISCPSRVLFTEGFTTSSLETSRCILGGFFEMGHDPVFASPWPLSFSLSGWVWFHGGIICTMGEEGINVCMSLCVMLMFVDWGSMCVCVCVCGALVLCLCGVWWGVVLKKW